MTISAHQPHFLPWLGYFNKVANSDVFVWLEDVQFRKNYFQNRTKIKAHNEELWLTVPVKKSTLDTPISDIEIVPGRDFLKIPKTIKNYYSKAPFFYRYYEEIEELITNNNTTLNELNFSLFTHFLKILEINTTIISSLSLQIEENDANNRLVEICKKLNATEYIAGKGGLNYMDTSLFKNNNIEVLWQNYPVDSISYIQLQKPFLQGLSILDVLFNVGKEKTQELINTPWK